MKKILLVLLLMFLTGCSNTPQEVEPTLDIENFSFQNQQSKTETKSAENLETPIKKEEQAPFVHIDLTKMSDTMVYSQVFDILVNPQNYVGKTIRLQGIYEPITDSLAQEVLHYIVVEDATACCAQGVEIKMIGEANYPELYSNAEVVGEIKTYEYSGQTFFYVETSADLIKSDSKLK